MTNAFDFEQARDFGTALLLGAMLGIEREMHKAREGYGTAGLRSFILLAQLGAIGGWLAKSLAMPWILVATIAAATALVVAGYIATTRRHPEHYGFTTELAAIVSCLLGALAATGNRELAVGLGVVTAAVLAYKEPLHDLVGRIGREDVLVGLRLLLATFIVLPLLPDHPIDPWGAVNPYQLWLLVLLISGLSLIGYVASRWLGPGRGVAVTAAAGGLVSSTAVTLALCKQSREPGASARQLAGGILLAWTIMFVRVLVTATLIAPPLFGRLWLPFGTLAVAGAVAAGLCIRQPPGQAAAISNSVPMKNPFSLRAAGKFAALFALVQLLLKVGQEYLPQSGIYAIAALAGLTDVDAITLSMAQRAQQVPADIRVAVLAITIASVSNTLVKAGLTVGTGRGLARFVLPTTLGMLAVGALARLVA